MDIPPICNDVDLRQALVEISRLRKAPRNTPEGDKLDALVNLVEAYEHVRWPLKPVLGVRGEKDEQWASLREIWARGSMSEDFIAEGRQQPLMPGDSKNEDLFD